MWYLTVHGLAAKRRKPSHAQKLLLCEKLFMSVQVLAILYLPRLYRSWKQEGKKLIPCAKMAANICLYFYCNAYTMTIIIIMIYTYMYIYDTVLK